MLAGVEVHPTTAARGFPADCISIDSVNLCTVTVIETPPTLAWKKTRQLPETKLRVVTDSDFSVLGK